MTAFIIISDNSGSKKAQSAIRRAKKARFFNAQKAQYNKKEGRTKTMNNNFFSDCRTIEDVKRTFKELCKKLHPDNGGDAEQFKAMMQEYEIAFNRCKNFHTSASGETYEKETAETAAQFADIINKVIHFTGVDIERIGSWVWLSGNTMIYKEEIKAAGFIWSRSKRAWYYTGEENHKKRRGHYSMEQLRSRFGTVKVDSEEQACIA